VKTFLKKGAVGMRLGILNVYRVLSYRASIGLGISSACRIKAPLVASDFFAKVSQPRLPADSGNPQTAIAPTTKLVGVHEIKLSGAPYDWFLNFMSKRRFKDIDNDWWRIGDFGDGDIKGIWEISRFSWVPILALSAAQGNEESMTTLNRWLSDWCQNNPTYKGPNWKCGQETSIRILNLALGSVVLKQAGDATPALRAFIEASLMRVHATRSYALAQDNNHGTSEGAGLFVGGEWLKSLGIARGDRFAETGRRHLERLVRRLINDEGGFSQYSVNYHRVLVDTLSIVELCRRYFKAPEFSEDFYKRCSAAIKWLENLVDDQSGDAPNIGSNDGAHLLEFLNPEYRNYRFSVQFASSIFDRQLAFDASRGVRDALQLFDLEIPTSTRPQRVNFLDREAGFACMRRRNATACIRFPRFKFRPGHADALHLDLWVKGVNVLPDGGTYSYNCDAQTGSYFIGVESHNTIQFDDRNQMLRLSRFLYGGWPKRCGVGVLTETTFSVGYTDYLGARHERDLQLLDERLVVTDRFGGFTKKATLRWRLGRAGWIMVADPEGIRLDNDLEKMTLLVRSRTHFDRVELVRGFTSKYYGEMEDIQVLEVDVSRPGSVVTEISW
jgi:hypothetical protein